MNNSDLSSIQNSFMEYYNQEGDENDTLLGDLFEELYLLKKNYRETDLISILETSLNIMDYTEKCYRTSDYINNRDPDLINVYDNYDFITQINNLFRELTEQEKYSYWEFSIKTDCFLLIEHVIQSSKTLDLRQLFLRGINERWIKPNILDFFSRIFIIVILDELFSPSETISLDTSISIKKIILPQINPLLSGNISELSKVNVFIGQNNQSKSRFLKFIKVILLALEDLYEFGQKFSGKRFAENYCDDQEIKRIFEVGFRIEAEINDKVESGAFYSLWGWNFPVYKRKSLNFEIEFHQGFSKLINVESNLGEIPNKSEVEQILRNNIQFIYIDELSTINQEEEFPVNGWIGFDEQEAIKNLSHNFRRILAYNKWLLSDRFQDLEILPSKVFDQNIPSVKFIKKIKTTLEKWRLTSLLFFFGANYETFYGTDNITHFPTVSKYINQLLIDRRIWKTYGLEFDISFDESINRFKLARSEVVSEGMDISKQGHGIRTMALAFLSSIYCNFILIDEPENGLHLSLQKELAKHLIESYNNQVFIVTHSPSMIPHNYEAIVYLIHNNRISLKKLYPERWTDSSQFIERNMAQIRNIVGVRPEDLLFETAIIYFEGRTDISFYSDLFIDYGIKLNSVSGVNNLKTTWQSYRDFLSNNINENIIFIFDRDYFNDLIAETDDINGFTLPCYSFENLLLDPYFLSTILGVHEDKIRNKLLELVDNRKLETLDKLFIAHLFHTLEGQDASRALKKLRENLNVDWCTLDLEKLPDLLYEVWSAAEKEINRDDVVESGKTIKTICQEWETLFIYHVEIKSKINSYLDTIYESCLDANQKENLKGLTKNKVKKSYLDFIKKNDKAKIPESLTKRFIMWYKEVRKTLEL